MSSISFNTRKGDTAYVRGPDRHMFRHIVQQMFWAFMPDDADDLYRKVGFEERLRSYFEAYKRLEDINPYEANHLKFRAINMTQMVFNHSFGDLKFHTWKGQEDAWAAQLNTVIQYGNEVLGVLTQIDAQCEIHAWVSGKNRAWLAGVIVEGLRLKLFRPDMGWDGVVALLLSSSRGAVVMSYSVCDSFDFKKDKLDPGCEMAPGRKPKFGLGMTALDISDCVAKNGELITK